MAQPSEFVPQDVPHGGTRQRQRGLAQAAPEAILSVNHMRAVMVELQHFVYWKELGTNLGVDQGQLNVLERDASDSYGRLSKVIENWLKRNHNEEEYGPPTWRNLAKAIKPIDNALAMKIEAEHGISSAPAGLAATSLTIKNLREVRDALGYSSEWSKLGLNLGLHPDLLERISKDKHDLDDRLEEVLRTWLQKKFMDSDEGPTWNQLVVAVKPINPALSMKIREMHAAGLDGGEDSRPTQTSTEEMKLELLKSKQQLASAKAQLEEEEKIKGELQQILTRIEKEKAQLQVSLQEKEDRLKRMRESSQEQDIAVHTLQNEMQTLKDRMETKDAKFQQLSLELNKREGIYLDLEKSKQQLTSTKSQLEEEERMKEKLQQKLDNTEKEKSQLQTSLDNKENELNEVKKISRKQVLELQDMDLDLKKLKQQLESAKPQLEEEMRMKVELQQKLTSTEHDEAQLQISLQEKEGLVKPWVCLGIMVLLLAIGCGIWFVPPQSSTPPSKMNSVQRVVRCSETVLDIWGNKEQTVSWDGCGFNVTVPAGAVSKDVTDHVQLIVKANLSSKFQLLVDSHLVSATYWVFASHVFQKDVFVHLHHWANITSEEEASNYKLVVRKWSHETLSYRFKILNGVFSAHSQIATFSMKNFSGMQLQNEGEEKLIYEYHCYLIKTGPLKWKAVFLFTPQYPPDFGEFKDYTDKQIDHWRGGFKFESNSPPIRSENDESSIKEKTVTVVIHDSREGQAKDWEIVPLNKTEILQDEVDELNRNPSNATIPRCEISIKWIGGIEQIKHTKFSRRVDLQGSNGQNFFFIKFSPSADATSNHPEAPVTLKDGEFTISDRIVNRIIDLLEYIIKSCMENFTSICAIVILFLILSIFLVFLAIISRIK